MQKYRAEYKRVYGEDSRVVRNLASKAAKEASATASSSSNASASESE